MTSTSSYLIAILLGAFSITSSKVESRAIITKDNFYAPNYASFSLEKSITGTVTDANGEPLSGVNVVIKGTTRGTITDITGAFKISVERNDILVFSFVGFKSQQIIVTDKMSSLKVKLEDGESLSAVTSVGSRFSTTRTDVERPVPIDILTAKDIQSTGQIDLGQAIHYTAPSFASVKFGINDLAPLVDFASLRGLGSDQTLVLINGKRRHKVSFFSANEGLGRGLVGTDINAIPSSAVKQVEVLRDGAAAQYGSDAIAGVLNMQLNNNIKGGSFQVYGGSGSSDPKGADGNSIYGSNAQDGQTYKASLNFGLPLGDKGFINTTLAYQHSDSYDRSGRFTSKYYNGTVIASDSLVKLRNINLDRATIGSSDVGNLGLFINAGYDVNKNWKFYAFGGYSKKNVTGGFFTRAPSNRARAVEAIFPDGYNPSVPSVLKDFSLVAGFKGSLGNDWNMDISAGQGSNRVDLYIENTVNPSLGAASPTKFYTGANAVGQTTANVDITKSFKKGSYPNISVAIGSELRRESFEQIAGDKASYEEGPVKLQDKVAVDVGSSGREGYRPEVAGSWSRNNFGTYLEMESELSKNFLIGAAGRFENYSDFGSNFSYKGTARYEFADKFAVRGSVSRGFRAPSMAQVYFGSQTVQFAANGSSIKAYLVPARNVALGKALGVEALKPEVSLGYTYGITSKLLPELSITADFFSIDITDRIVASGNIATKGRPAFEAIGYSGASDAAIIFSNVVDTRTQGFDVVASYVANLGSKQKLTLNAAMNTSKTAITNNKNPEFVNANAEAYLTRAEPNSKLILMANYQVGKLDFLIRTTRFGEIYDPLALYDVDKNGDGKIANYKDASGGTIMEVDAAHQGEFSAKFVTDAAISYNITQKLGITLGVNNFMDVYPDLLRKPQTSGEVIFSRRTNQWGTQGRFGFATVHFNF
jgi:iron complex outermembrane recepter protein